MTTDTGCSGCIWEEISVQCQEYPHTLNENQVVPKGKYQGCGRGGTPVFSGVFEPVARVALFPTDENGLGSCFGAA